MTMSVCVCMRMHECIVCVGACGFFSLFSYTPYRWFKSGTIVGEKCCRYAALCSSAARYDTICINMLAGTVRMVVLTRIRQPPQNMIRYGIWCVRML